jgi:autophagy-related protein 17
MASPPSAARADQPHLVSLVLQSKKALQHGEQLCSKANALTNASAQCAVDVLALDAKVKWISEAVIEQLKVRHVTSDVFFSRTLTQLAASVAKSIEYKRAQVDKQIRVRFRPPRVCAYQHTAGMGRHPFGAYLRPRCHP